MTSYESHLALQVERWDHTTCPECGDLVHRGDMDGEMCAVCATYDEKENTK